MEKTGIISCRNLGRRIFRLSALAVVAASLGACASSSGVTEFTANQCKQISKRAEAKINWARVPDVELVVRNGEFSPMVTRLKQGRPYVLRVRNRDEENRVFRAQKFFEQNAVIAVGVEGVRSEQTCFAAVGIPARQTAEIRFVAITDGTFEYEDNEIMLPWVMSGGPSGAIIIDERRETADLN